MSYKKCHTPFQSIELQYFLNSLIRFRILNNHHLPVTGNRRILHPRQSFSTTQEDVSAPQSNWFIRGMLGNVLNPKMGIFYVSFLPQFIPAGQPLIAWTFLLVTIHVVIGTLWSLTLIMMTGYASRLLKSRRFIRWMDRLTGGLFMFFAVKLALSHR
ncbi:TPA: LysE family translocator [Morganella morganii]|nr:LysE family translocator [Morganella morganii]